MPDPIRPHGDRPIAQQRPDLIGPVQPRVQAAPSPILRALHKSRAQRISLGVTQHPFQMLVALHEKILEASLVDVPAADEVVRRLPARRVSQAQVSEELRELAVFLGPDNEMPVIAHDVPGEQTRVKTLIRLQQHSIKRLEILLLLKQPQPAVGAVENMIDVSARSDAGDSGHAGRISEWTSGSIK